MLVSSSALPFLTGSNAAAPAASMASTCRRSDAVNLSDLGAGGNELQQNAFLHDVQTSALGIHSGT
jgi:hypothetical protein